MQAQSLKIKKQYKKWKIKKTMKNVICRPDPSFWPRVSEEEGKTITEVLNTLKVEVPDFKKPLWRDLCQIPKALRPKPPPIPRVEGLIFGIGECQKSIDTNECAGVLIGDTVNPKSIVQPLIERCSEKSVPVLCLKELRSTSKVNFGISTSVLGVKRNCLVDLEQKILAISKYHKPPKIEIPVNIDEENIVVIPQTDNLEEVKRESISSPYLLRVSKSDRVFTPVISEKSANLTEFAKQDYIKINNEMNKTTDNKQYMKMIVKRISNNPNRKANAKN